MLEVQPKPAALDYRRPDLRRRRRVRTLGEEAAKIAALAAVLTWYGFEGSVDKGARLFLLAGAALTVVVVGVCLARWVSGFRAEPLGARMDFTGQWRYLVALIILLTLTAWPTSLRHRYSCWHGERWYNSTFGVARAPGGPCGNGPFPRGSKVWQLNSNWYFYLAR